MAVSVQCPQCNALYSISEAFPGSRVNCTQCGTILILDLQVEEPSRIPIVPPTSGPRHIDEKSPQFMKAAFQHLASWLDVSTSELEQAFNLVQSDQAYDLWKIPKGDGYSFREISAPKEVLKNVQRRILDRLLYRIPISNAAHGFIQGRSIVTNASYHLKNAQSIFNLDLKGAFPSVKAARVKHLLVRYLKIPLKHLGEQVQHSVLDKVIEILVKLTTYNDGLPQGSPASGYLLNVACITLDKNLLRLLQQHSSSYRYTRYADDMTISAPGELPEELREKIQKVVMNCGFEINPQKIHYADRTKGQMLEVTGLILEKGKIRIPASRMEEFRVNIHQASQLAPEQLTPEKKVEIQSVVAFVKMVYDRMPNRLWTPYKAFMEKHKLPYPRATARPKWEQYL